MRHPGWKDVRNALAVLVVLSAVGVLAGLGGRDDGTFFGKTYKDDFTGRYAWPEWSGGGSLEHGVSKKHEAYRIIFRSVPWVFFAEPYEVFPPRGNRSVADTRQKVDVRGVKNLEDMTMGLLCRHYRGGGPMTAYAFHVSSRGGPRWRIVRLAGGESTVLKEGAGNFNLKKWTRLEAICKGNTLTFKVDGRQVAKVRDSALKTGANAIVGAAVSTQKRPLVGLFDNYELSY